MFYVKEFHDMTNKAWKRTEQTETFDEFDGEKVQKSNSIAFL